MIGLVGDPMAKSCDRRADHVRLIKLTSIRTSASSVAFCSLLRWDRGAIRWTAVSRRVDASNLSGQFKNQIYWVLATVGLTAVWLTFVYLVRPDEIGTITTAGATACLIALIQAHYKK